MIAQLRTWLANGLQAAANIIRPSAGPKQTDPR